MRGLNRVLLISLHSSPSPTKTPTPSSPRSTQAADDQSRGPAYAPDGSTLVRAVNLRANPRVSSAMLFKAILPWPRPTAGEPRRSAAPIAGAPSGRAFWGIRRRPPDVLGPKPSRSHYPRTLIRTAPAAFAAGTRRVSSQSLRSFDGLTSSLIGMIERSVPTELDHPNVGYGRIRRDSGLPSGTRDS